MGKVRILMALQAVLLTLSSVGCSGPISVPQALATTSSFATAGHAPWEPGLILLPEQFGGAHEVLATDETPLIQQSSCAANEPRSIEAPTTAPPLINTKPGIPHDSNGEVVNPFRGGRLDGFATADKQAQDAPSDPPSTEIITIDTSAEATLPAANTQAQSNDAITPGLLLEPAPLDLPPSESSAVNVAQAKSPPEDDSHKVISESASIANETVPSPSAAPGPISIASIETVIEDVAPVEPAELELPPAEIPPAKSHETPAAPSAPTSSVAMESKSSCEIPEPPAIIAAMNFLDVPTSSSTSKVFQQAAPAPVITTGTALLPPTPETTQLESLNQSSDATPARVVRAAFQAEPVVAAAPAPSPLPTQATIPVPQINAPTTTPAPAPAPPTFQIAISPDSPVATIPMTATIRGPNGQAQALLVIRVETTLQPNVATPIAQPAAPQRSFIASELSQEPSPVQQPAVVRPNPIGLSFSTDQLGAWRRAKPPTESREVEAPAVSDRISQHLSHSLAQ